MNCSQWEPNGILGPRKIANDVTFFGEATSGVTKPYWSCLMFSPRFVVELELLDKPQVLPESLKKLQLFGFFDDFLQYIYIWVLGKIRAPWDCIY